MTPETEARLLKLLEEINKNLERSYEITKYPNLANELTKYLLIRTDRK